MWDSSIDFKDKTVAVVGSGASAIQAIPELRRVAKHLISYQRTPAWIAPRDQFAYSRVTKFLLRHVPFLMRIFRNTIFFQVHAKDEQAEQFPNPAFPDVNDIA